MTSISKDLAKLSENKRRLIKALSIENRKPILKNAAKVFEKAAKRNTPTQSGKLKDSISVQEGSSAVFVGPTVPYARYVEYKTQHVDARPYMRPAFVSGRDAVAKQIKKGFESLLKKYKAKL